MQHTIFQTVVYMVFHCREVTIQPLAMGVDIFNICFLAFQVVPRAFSRICVFLGETRTTGSLKAIN